MQEARRRSSVVFRALDGSTCIAVAAEEPPATGSFLPEVDPLRKILIADPDIETVRALRGALKADYEVIAVRDGSKALEQSVLRYPDLILFYRHCPLIGATQFLRILRANPRTEEVPLIILANERLAAPKNCRN